MSLEAEQILQALAIGATVGAVLGAVFRLLWAGVGGM